MEKKATLVLPTKTANFIKRALEREISDRQKEIEELIETAKKDTEFHYGMEVEAAVNMLTFYEEALEELMKCKHYQGMNAIHSKREILRGKFWEWESSRKTAKVGDSNE